MAAAASARRGWGQGHRLEPWQCVRLHDGRRGSPGRGRIAEVCELVAEDDIAGLFHGRGEELVVGRLAFEGTEGEVEADHLGARLCQSLDERHVLAPRPRGRAETLDALLVDGDDGDLGARPVGATQRLPAVEEHQVGDSHRGHDFRPEANQDESTDNDGDPPSKPAAGNERLVEQRASFISHGEPARMVAEPFWLDQQKNRRIPQSIRGPSRPDDRSRDAARRPYVARRTARQGRYSRARTSQLSLQRSPDR